MIKKYRELVEEIEYQRSDSVSFGFFELRCEGINKELCRRAENIVTKLLTKVSMQAQEHCKGLCAQFDDIAEKALTTPKDTDHLVELRDFVSKSEKETVPRLEQEIVFARRRLDLLLEQTTLTT